jgi:hypothetical protein
MWCIIAMFKLFVPSPSFCVVNTTSFPWLFAFIYSLFAHCFMRWAPQDLAKFWISIENLAQAIRFGFTWNLTWVCCICQYFPNYTFVRLKQDAAGIWPQSERVCGAWFHLSLFVPLRIARTGNFTSAWRKVYVYSDTCHYTLFIW